MKRKDRKNLLFSKAAILVLAEIKAATQAFDRGETNVFEALENIVMAVETYRSASRPRQDVA